MLQNLSQKLKWVGKKMQIAEKSRALILLEKGDSMIAVARNIGFQERQFIN